MATLASVPSVPGVGGDCAHHSRLTSTSPLREIQATGAVDLSIPSKRIELEGVDTDEATAKVIELLRR